MANCAIGGRSGTWQAQFPIEARRKDTGSVRPRGEILAIQRRQAFGTPDEEFLERFAIFGLTILAEPLQFVLIAVRAETDKLRDPGIEPAERVWKRK